MGGPTDTHFDESARLEEMGLRDRWICTADSAAAQNADQQDFSLIYCARVFIIGGDRKWISDCEFTAAVFGIDFIMFGNAARKTVRSRSSVLHNLKSAFC
jgi:hypothetical protein